MVKGKLYNNEFFTKGRILNCVYYTLSYFAAIVLNILISGQPYWDFAWKLFLVEAFVVVSSCEFVRMFLKSSKCKIWQFVCYEIAIIIINIFIIVWLSDCMNLFFVTAIELSSVYLAAMIGNPFLVINEKKRIEEVRKIEEEKHRLELYYLNLQLNPHFLFNTLNVIYVQSRKEKATSTSDMVMHLSELLRYQLYESVDKKVMLKSEVKHIENYIELQKMRHTDLQIDYQTEGKFDGIMLYPFMSISFLENAFKYVGVNNSGEKFVKFFVGVDEKYVSFVVQNTKCDDVVASESEKHKSRGIGIQNTKKRLDLLYAGKYVLDIKDNGKYFIVELKILLEND